MVARHLKGSDPSTAAWEFVRVLYANSLIVDFPWMQWQRFGRDPMERMQDTIDELGSASAEDALRLATGIARAQRFSSGRISEAGESGLVGAIVDRLLQWRTPIG